MAKHPTPLERLLVLLREERPPMRAVVGYTVASGILLFIVPLTVQALVNTIAQGIFAGPIATLAVLVLLALAGVGAIQISLQNLVEGVQRRVFARSALRVADRLGRIRTDELRHEYAPELVNRFFDVLTIQKSLSKLLLDGAAAAFQATLGAVLLATYDPLLLVLDLVLVGGLFVILLVTGHGGLRTSMAECHAKYRAAEWLEDCARGTESLKLHASPDYGASRMDDLATEYVLARDAHYRVTRRQTATFYGYQAIAGSAMLGLGGFLVLQGRLSLGQLVAAQIVIALVLAAAEKLVRNASEFYDLLTGLDKVGHLEELPTERTGGDPFPASPGPLGVELRRTSFGYVADRAVLDGLSATIRPGARLAIVGASGSGKSTLGRLLAGLETPAAGGVFVDGTDLRSYDLDSYRRQIGYAGLDESLLGTTVADNVRLGRDSVGPTDLAEAFELVDLRPTLAALPDGAATEVRTGGGSLAKGERERIQIARAIAGRPRLLIVDEALGGLDEPTALEVLRRLADPSRPWTLVLISHRAALVAEMTDVMVLAGGTVVSHGPLERSLAECSEMRRLHPELLLTRREVTA